MSLFATVDVPCPSCGKPVSFEAVNSVNAVGRPDLRVTGITTEGERVPVLVDGAWQV